MLWVCMGRWWQVAILSRSSLWGADWKGHILMSGGSLFGLRKGQHLLMVLLSRLDPFSDSLSIRLFPLEAILEGYRNRGSNNKW